MNKNVLNPKSDIKITESKDLFLRNVERLPETDKLAMLVLERKGGENLSIVKNQPCFL